MRTVRPQSESQFLFYLWSRLLIGILLIVVVSVLIGCSMTTPVVGDPVEPNSPIVTDHAPAEEIWQALARAVKSRTIDSTTRLAQYVVVLGRNRELSERDIAGFDAAFPHIAKESRTLTDADANVIALIKPKG